MNQATREWGERPNATQRQRQPPIPYGIKNISSSEDMPTENIKLIFTLLNFNSLLFLKIYYFFCK